MAALRTGFGLKGFRACTHASAVVVLRPNGDGVLAVVPADKLEARVDRPLPSHAEMNAVRFAKKEVGSD